MKFFKRLNKYKNSTGTNEVCINSGTAWSYGWWKYYDKETGIFNGTFYSVSTRKHQSDTSGILHQLGWPIRLKLKRTKKSLTNLNEALNDEVSYINQEIKDLGAKLYNLKNKNCSRAFKYRQNIDDLELNKLLVLNQLNKGE